MEGYSVDWVLINALFVILCDIVFDIYLLCKQQQLNWFRNNVLNALRIIDICVILLVCERVDFSVPVYNIDVVIIGLLLLFW